MRKARKTVTLVDIRTLVRQIVERFRPKKVVLFGSHVRGAASADSDVDLLVVMDTDQKPIHAAADIAADIDHPFPLDILVVRPDDFEASVRRKGVFASEVATEGLVLYEA